MIIRECRSKTRTTKEQSSYRGILRSTTEGKHVALAFYFVRMKDKSINDEYCQSNEVLADILTKGLPRQTFEKLRKQLGVTVINIFCKIYRVLKSFILLSVLLYIYIYIFHQVGMLDHIIFMMIHLLN